MHDIYIKHYWEEDDITFYLHYHNDWAKRQIEEHPNGKIFFLSENQPIQGEAMLADQKLSDADQLEEVIKISKADFELKWNTQYDKLDR